MSSANAAYKTTCFICLKDTCLCVFLTFKLICFVDNIFPNSACFKHMAQSVLQNVPNANPEFFKRFRHFLNLKQFSAPETKKDGENDAESTLLQRVVSITSV